MDDRRPTGWKNYEDFAAGIATNRLPSSDALVGRTLHIAFPGQPVGIECTAVHEMHWVARGADADTGWYEAIRVAPDTWFIDTKRKAAPKEAFTLIVNERSLRVLGIRCQVNEARAGVNEPRVQQEFLVGTLEVPGREASGMVPHVTRDLIGLRTFQTYSPNHTYEHTYLNSERYAWQCLVGVQRGQGDVDMASYYQFAADQYVFTFREFLIPVASVFFFNFASGRSTGKFLGVTGAGEVENNPAGAFMRRASMTFYDPEATPA
ncbi:MAG TPA: MoaF C-terminal domain-containing protein [Nevskiaceae bacterium]